MTASLPGEDSPACECVPDCLDVATGVLMERHGLEPNEARGVLLGSAAHQSTSAHVVSRQVIEAVTDAREVF